MSIGLTIFCFVFSVLAICGGAVWGVRYTLLGYRGLDQASLEEARRQRLIGIRAGLVAAGALVLLAGFVTLPALFHREATVGTARVVPILQFLAFLCLVSTSAYSEYVLRRLHGEGRALWRLAARVALLEGLGLAAAVLTAAAILLLPRWGLAHFGKLRWWDPYFVMPLSALAVAGGILARALTLPLVMRRLFHATLWQAEDGGPAQTIVAAHAAFRLLSPKIYALPADGAGRMTANRRGLLGRHVGWKRERVFVAAELCAQLTAEELEALSRREVAHGILQTARRRLGRAIAVGEALLVASWLYPKLQVPMSVAFGLDARFVHLWVPVIAITVSGCLAIRGWMVSNEDDEHRADLYAVEVLGAPVSALSHGLRRVFSGTVAEARALDRRLAALDEGLRAPRPVRLMTSEEREALALHHRRVGFGVAGGFALVLLGIGLSPYGQRTTLQWRVAMAIRAHDAKQVAQLLARGASPNRENLFGVSPVSAAAGAGDLDMLRALISHGGAVQNELWPQQPLHAAAAQGRTDVIAYLLQNGAQVNAPDFFGRTALMVAAANGHRLTVNYLVEHGARIGARDQSGHTAQQLAENRGDRDIAHALRRASR